MLRRLQVRILRSEFAMNLYVSLVFRVSMNFEDGKKLPSWSGICNRTFVDLNRYGCGNGAGEEAV